MEVCLEHHCIPIHGIPKKVAQAFCTRLAEKLEAACGGDIGTFTMIATTENGTMHIRIAYNKPGKIENVNTSFDVGTLK
jgi:hypothetical protein